MRASLFVVCLTAASGLTAQAGVRPVAPHVTIESAGPAGWRSRLGPTNLGVLFSSKEGRSIWEPMIEPMLEAWAALAGGAEAYRETSERLLSYEGTVRVAIRVSEREIPDVAITFEGDRRTEMTKVADELTRLLEAMVPGSWLTREVRGATVRSRELDGSYVTAPSVDAGRMTMLLGGEGFEETAMGLGAWLAARPATLASPAPNSPALRAVLDLEALLRDTGREGDRSLLAPLGLDALRTLTFTLAAAGPHLQLGADVAIEGPPRGLVKALMPNSQGLSALSNLLPQQSLVAKIARFDAQALVRGVITTLEQDDEDARTTLAESLGINIDRELFAHATDEMMVLGSPLRDFDRASEATWLLAWRLRDEARFREGFLKLTKAHKALLSTAETVDVDGVELRRYGTLALYDLWMTVGNDLWIVAAGRDAQEAATDLLRRAAAADWRHPPAPAAFGDLERHLPAGLNGLSRADLAGICETPVEWYYDGLMPGLLAPPLRPSADEDELQAMVDATSELLSKNNLAQLRTATGSAAGTWRWRLYW